MSENGTKRRFNVLDIAIIVLVLLAVIGVWQRQNLQNLFTADELLEQYTVSFEIQKVRSTTIDQLKKGDALYVEGDEGQILLGTLNDQLSVAAATVYLQDRDGNTVKAVYPQDANEYLLDASGVLRCEGVEHDDSFLLGGKLYLAVNQTVSARSETADLEIRIISIEKVQ